MGILARTIPLVAALVSLTVVGCRVEDPNSDRMNLKRLLVEDSWHRFSEAFYPGEARPVDFTSLGFVIYDKTRIGDIWAVPEAGVVELAVYGRESRFYRWYAREQLLAYCHPGFGKPFLMAPDSIDYEQALQRAQNAGVVQCDEHAILSIAGATVDVSRDSTGESYHIDLNGVIPNWQTQTALRSLYYVRSLDLSCSNVTDGDLPGIVALDALEELDLSNTGITDAGLILLTRMRGLKKVSVGNSEVTREGIDRMLGRRALVDVDTLGPEC